MRKLFPGLLTIVFCVGGVRIATTAVRGDQPVPGVVPAQAQLDNTNRGRLRLMLRQAYDNVRKHYYDAKFRGLDLDAAFADFDAQMKAVTTMNNGLILVAGFLDQLQDSHTYFVPPARPYDFDYGYLMQAFGDDVRVSQVRPATDAAGKLHRGDAILAVNGVPVDRSRLEPISRLLNQLSPQPVTRLTVRDPSGHVREVAVTTRTRPGKRQLDLTSLEGEDIWKLVREAENQAELVQQQYYEVGDAMVWKMPEFYLEDADVDRLFDVARKHSTLILDLRGNPGGVLDTLSRMVGNVFPQDVTIAERVSRRPQKPIVAKGRGSRAFAGELVVLIDADSASAAEMFARVVQLEGRGNVIGDRSAGSVMQSLVHVGSSGVETVISYYFSITDADVLMKDGKSLERVGVAPDELIIPTNLDLSEGRDPVMVRALQRAGITMDATKAGAMFPFKWKPF